MQWYHIIENCVWWVCFLLLTSMVSYRQFAQGIHLIFNCCEVLHWSIWTSHVFFSHTTPLAKAAYEKGSLSRWKQHLETAYTKIPTGVFPFYKAWIYQHTICVCISVFIYLQSCAYMEQFCTWNVVMNNHKCM